MHRRAASFTRRLLLAGISVGLCGCGLLAVLLLRTAPDQSIAARAQWQAHRIAHYRLVVQEDTPADSCQQDLQIQDEQIQAVQANHCGHLPSWTISNLFTWSAHLVQGSQCYPTSVTCVCYRISTARTTYDPRFGYPQKSVYEWTLQPNWGYGPHWERLWRTGELPDCRAVARQANGYIRISVVAITPLP